MKDLSIVHSKVNRFWFKIVHGFSHHAANISRFKRALNASKDMQFWLWKTAVNRSVVKRKSKDKMHCKNAKMQTDARCPAVQESQRSWCWRSKLIIYPSSFMQFFERIFRVHRFRFNLYKVILNLFKIDVFNVKWAWQIGSMEIPCHGDLLLRPSSKLLDS